MSKQVRQFLRRWHYALAGFALGLYEMFHGIPDVTSLTGDELLSRAIKATPIILLGLLGKSIMLPPLPEEKNDVDKS